MPAEVAVKFITGLSVLFLSMVMTSSLTQTYSSAISADAQTHNSLLVVAPGLSTVYDVAMNILCYSNALYSFTFLIGKRYASDGYCVPLGIKTSFKLGIASLHGKSPTDSG